MANPTRNFKKIDFKKDWHPAAQISISQILKFKSDIVVMTSTGQLRSRIRHDYKHVKGGACLNYGDCEF